MATPYFARRTLPPNSRASLATRVLVFWIWNRVRISQVLFGGLLLFDIFVARIQPRNVLDVRDPLTVVGLLLVVLGLLARTWAAGTLKKEKALVTSGPFALVRNPLYVGSFLMMAGLCILMNDQQAIWVVMGPVATLYWLAVLDEERLLAELFSEEWPAYAARVPRFVPRLLVAPTMEGWSLRQWRRNREFNAWLGAAAALAGLLLWRMWAV